MTNSAEPTTVTREELDERRVKYTPQVIEALRALSDATTKVADQLEATPGDGLGLTYAALWIAWERVEARMRYYQNDLQHLLPRPYSPDLLGLSQ